LSQTRRQRIGKWGEETAARYLEENGYTVLARNARTVYGEIDLVVRSPQDEFVFVEVKTRTGQFFGNPEEAVDIRKLAHMAASAQAYMLENVNPPEDHWRIDVISVQGRPGQEQSEVRIDHFENIAA